MRSRRQIMDHFLWTAVAGVQIISTAGVNLSANNSNDADNQYGGETAEGDDGKWLEHAGPGIVSFETNYRILRLFRQNERAVFGFAVRIFRFGSRKNLRKTMKLNVLGVRWPV